MELLVKNNPNILELLATPEDCILFKHPLMEKLSADFFLSQLCKDTFGGYAMTQVRKARGLNKKMMNPMSRERKTVIDFCFVPEGHNAIPLEKWLADKQYLQEHCGLSRINHSKGVYALFHNKAGNFSGIVRQREANEVALSEIPKGEVQKGYLLFEQAAKQSMLPEAPDKMAAQQLLVAMRETLYH